MYCNDTFVVWWDILLWTHAKFTAKSGSETILKIDQHLAKLKARVELQEMYRSISAPTHYMLVTPTHHHFSAIQKFDFLIR